MVPLGGRSLTSEKNAGRACFQGIFGVFYRQINHRKYKIIQVRPRARGLIPNEVIYGLRREKLGLVGATIDHVHRLGIDCFQYFPPFSGSLSCLYIVKMVT
jgi:hypothetical protein